MKRNLDDSGAVAIHRWFADGEGWAYHPWFQSRIHELLTAVKPELDNRADLRTGNGTEKRFVLAAMDGFLLGQQERDMKCLDPRAVERFPTILRVVYLRERPEGQEIERITDDLAGLHADRAGTNADLKIIAAQTTPLPKPSLGRGHWLGKLLAVAVAVIAGGAILWQMIGTRQPQVDKEVREAGDRMKKLLERWQFDEKEAKAGNEDTLRVAKRFFGALCQDRIGVPLEGNHPDVRFLSRLPKSGAQPQTQEQLRSALESLLGELKETKGPGKLGPSGRSLIMLIEEIDLEMDYRRWWNGSGKTLDYAASERANKKASEQARKFLGESATDRANSGWQQPAAKTMLTELQKWKVDAVSPEDAERRPWMIYHCFFQLLSQHHFQPVDVHEDCWQVEFVKRLPKNPLTDDGVFASEEDLIQKLRALAERLGTEKSDAVSTLVTNISSSMDYSRWRKQAEGVIRREVEKGSPKVDRFVERFRATP